MSKRRKIGDWVWVRPGAGFGASRGEWATIIDWESNREEELAPCVICFDDDCREFGDLETDDGHMLYHVSECEMFDEENTMGMTPREYQWLAARTLIDAPGFEIPDEQIMVLWNAIGLAGESGEVCEIVKKGIFHQHGLEREKLHKELGDVMWYVAALCTKLGFDLGDVMAANIEKLKQRYPNGYSSEDSKRRADV